MRLLCITEPNTHPPFDTTVELYQILSKRDGIEFFHTTPYNALASSAEELLCSPVSSCTNFDEFLNLPHSTLGVPWTFFDVVFCRTDKPFPDGYHSKLSLFESMTQFVNLPSGCAIASRRSFLKRFSHLMPAALTTREKSEALDFVDRYKKVVLKLDESFGGRGIYRFTIQKDGSVIRTSLRDERSFAGIDAALAEFFPALRPVQLVRYLPRAEESGDKRVLVVGGEILGGYIRKSAEGAWIHNISSGGSAHASEVTKEEQEVVDKTWPEYAAIGMLTLGYDFLMNDDGRWILSEINAGNIGGYGRLQELSGTPVYERLFGYIFALAETTNKPQGIEAG